MMGLARSTAAAAAFATFVLWASSASAALHVCNQTSYVAYAAVGFQSGANMVTQGWTRIAPGACAAAVNQPLAATAYFLYARSSQAHSGPPRNWGGAIQLCAKDANFSLKSQLGLLSCSDDDAFMMPFAGVDTHRKTDWTTTLAESKTIATLDAARSAGIDRLLRDIGYRGGVNGADASKARDQALAKFRARMKLPATAGAGDLIDALETEALKAAAPAGYSICNDTTQPFWAAVGLKSGSDWVSRGWWQVAAGACAKAFTDPLSTDKVYLYATRHGNNHLAAGKAKFCTTDIEFEIFGREHCASRGLTETGFAETNTKGVSGYAAHVSDDGLVPPAQH